jgi:septal ring-binding cell division protein DamX
MGGLSSLASLGLNVALGQEAAKRESKELKKERDRQLAAIMRDSQEVERQQANALRRRQARERARAGATGTATTGGSIDAILRGLEREAELDGAARRAATNARVQQIRDTFGTRRRNNLLTTTNRLLGGSASSIGRSLLG